MSVTETIKVIIIILLTLSLIAFILYIVGYMIMYVYHLINLFLPLPLWIYISAVVIYFLSQEVAYYKLKGACK